MNYEQYGFVYLKHAVLQKQNRDFKPSRFYVWSRGGAGGVGGDIVAQVPPQLIDKSLHVTIKNTDWHNIIIGLYIFC